MAISGLRQQQKVVTVFGSSRPKPGEPEYILAYDVGRELANAGFTVCSGGYGGIMEASSRGAKNVGGHTIGIVTDYFSRKPNEWVDTAVTMKTMVDRMLELVNRGNAYVILKGGTGTLLELAAVWEFMNKGIIQEKPIVVVGNFWDGVVNTLKEELAWEGLADCTRFVSVARNPGECAELIRRTLERQDLG